MKKKKGRVMKFWQFFSGLAFSVLLFGCAHSPQQLTVNPDVEIVGERYGRGQAVVVQAEDQRQNKVLGSLGGAYSESSTITLAEGMESALIRATEAHLAAQGFNTTSQQSNAAVFKLIVESLDYDISKQWVGKMATLKTVLKTEVSSVGETYTARYQTEKEQLLAATPSQEKSQQLVNELITETLVRVFSDQKLKAFMSNL